MAGREVYTAFHNPLIQCICQQRGPGGPAGRDESIAVVIDSQLQCRLAAPPSAWLSGCLLAGQKGLGVAEYIITPWSAAILDPLHPCGVKALSREGGFLHISALGL